MEPTNGSEPVETWKGLETAGLKEALEAILGRNTNRFPGAYLCWQLI